MQFEFCITDGFVNEALIRFKTLNLKGMCC